jgi:PAS domain S-box-containing protein
LLIIGMSDLLKDLVVSSHLVENTTSGLPLQRYELLFDLATQILAAQKLDERLLLILDAIKTNFHFPQVAIALIDERNASLRMRMSIGFPDNNRVESIEASLLDPSTPYTSAIHSGQSEWITRNSGEDGLKLLNDLGCDVDLLAIPLFGRSVLSAEGEITNRSFNKDRHLGAELICLGSLYIGMDQKSVSEADLNLLMRFSSYVGVAIASAINKEKLVTNVENLKQERQWVESIMKSVADPIVLTNLDNNILLQNRRAEELFNGPKDASEGRQRALAMNDLLFSAYLSSAAFSTAGIVGRDLTLIDPIEGSDIHFEVVSTPALNEQGDRIGLVSVFRDVTDLRRANEELARNFAKLQHAEAEARRERDRLDLIIENVGHPVVVCEPDGEFILFNRRAELLFQQDLKDSSYTAAVSSNVTKLKDFICRLTSDPESDRKTEIQLTDPETNETLPMEITSGEVLDAKGNVTAVVSILHDLRELRELERRRVEQQLFESEKLAAIGRLAASIAHEVNNPLEAIKNSLYLLQTNKNESSNARFLDIARRETERVSHIIRQMLGFARRSGDVEWVNINQILEETLLLVEKKLRQSSIKSVAEYSADLPVIRARADQLRQVFLNLILNAHHAIENGGTITVKTARYAQSLLPSIVVKISDTGKGISEEDMTRIFEPFFSTRRKGTGLGLWVTQDIVRHHGGSIEVESVEKQGTTFNVILPVDSPTLNVNESNEIKKRE